MRKIQPISEHVLVRVVKREVSAGGIHLVDAKVSPAAELLEAEVMAVGPGIPFRLENGEKAHVPMQVSVGNFVVFESYSAGHVPNAHADERELRIVSSQRIVALIEAPGFTLG